MGTAAEIASQLRRGNFHGCSRRARRWSGAPLNAPIARCATYGQNEKYLSLENFKLILSKVPRYVRIDFSGMAEPWANPEATAMLAHALVRSTRRSKELAQKSQADRRADHQNTRSKSRFYACICRTKTEICAVLVIRRNSKPCWALSSALEKAASCAASKP